MSMKLAALYQTNHRRDHAACGRCDKICRYQCKLCLAHYLCGDFANYIVIDPGFTWTRTTAEKGEVELPEIPITKIDFNTTANTCKFNYDTAPCLYVRKGEDLSLLRNVPAIRRQS